MDLYRGDSMGPRTVGVRGPIDGLDPGTFPTWVVLVPGFGVSWRGQVKPPCRNTGISPGFSFCVRPLPILHGQHPQRSRCLSLLSVRLGASLLAVGMLEIASEQVVEKRIRVLGVPGA